MTATVFLAVGDPDAAAARDRLPSLTGREMLAWHPTPTSRIPIVGVPSASLALPYKDEPLARYNLYRLQPGANRPRIEMIARGLAEPNGPIVELARKWIEPNPA